MVKKNKKVLLLLFLLALLFSCGGKTGNSVNSDLVSVKDGLNRELKIPATVSRIICSGAGALRYITYMECQDKVIAVDDLEKKQQPFDARPYTFANPRFMELPLFGEFRGQDNPELISALDPQPDLVFKTYAEMGFNPDELTEKTGIPVFVLDYGDLGKNRPAFYQSLNLIGKVMKKEKRAGDIERFIDGIIADLDKRTRDIQDRKTCYIGGVAYRGPLGLQSTEPGYPPFLFLNTPNAAIEPEQGDFAHMNVSKEKIVEWDPDIIFIDLATFQSDPKANAVYELSADPAYKGLRAAQSGNVYGVLPYNWYTQNHGSTLANTYYIGKVLYPDRFADIDPVKKADEIYTFLVGKPVFDAMNASFGGRAYGKMEI